MSWQWGLHSSSLEVNVLMEFVPEKTIITLAAVSHQHSSTEESCRKHSVDHSHCDMIDASSKCNATGNFTVPECSKVSEKISCTFFNVSPGFHCVTITVQDDRCIEHSVFKPELCTWRTESAIAVDGGLRDTPEVKVNPVSAFYLTLVSIITIIILFFIGVIIYMFKKRPPIITILDEPMDEIIPMVSKKKVLLLYPRDCEQFMTVMKSFRELLEKSHNIEVFDCYNNDDVLDGPLDWLQSKLRNPNFYVLIVISRCSYLHQEAILAGDWGSSYSLYREPSFLDKIFIYGLRWVMKDISANPFFCKKFIIGFRGFSEDEDMLSVPVNWTRYIIPDHLDRLLTDMNIYISPAGNLNNTVQHVNLESEIHCLCKFKSENPYYLSGILAI